MSEDPDFDMEVVEDDELDSYAPSDSSTEADVSTGGELEQEQPIGQERPKTQTADSWTVKLGPKELSIPSVWNITTFEEANESEKPIGYGVVKPGPHIENGIPLIRITDVVDGRLEVGQDFHRISDELDEQYSRSRLDGGELLVSIQGTVGEVVVAPSELDGANISRTLARITPGEGLNTYWVKYFLGSKEAQDYIEVVSSGSTRASYNIGDIRKTKLPVPPLSEQRKIASVLYAVDQAIQKTEAIIEQAKRVKRGAERKLFRRGYYQHGVSEKRLTVLPTDWKFEPLEEHTQSSAFGPRFSGDLYDDDGNVAVLRTTDLDSQGRITHETMPRAALDLQEIEDHIVEKGDLLITRSGTTGITTVWDGYRIPVIPGAFLIRFRLSQSVDPSFLKYYINSDVGGRRVDRRAKGGVQKNLAGSDLLNMRFPIPPMEEQEEIVKVLDGFDAQITQEKNLRDRLQSLKKGLMQDLLTGEVRTMGKAIEVLGEVKAHG